MWHTNVFLTVPFYALRKPVRQKGWLERGSWSSKTKDAVDLYLGSSAREKNNVIQPCTVRFFLIDALKKIAFCTILFTRKTMVYYKGVLK